MLQKSNNKRYDLEERTYQFAKRCRVLIKQLPKNTSNLVDSKQLARSSGSIAANYIEANEALSKKDFVHRIRISRKESKESALWLNLIEVKEDDIKERDILQDEAMQFVKIFNSIIEKSK